ncbi:MAG TPA: PAS domain-containing sensor histidine kinase, partial [Candidatus Thermoplasmatota archaeon]|nr:PAS domain-containing sensor histidine kinase [Candidatus Thermoplasmatota archaeon]
MRRRMGDGSGRHQFFERCPAPAAIIGFDGTVEDANDAWREPTGWRAEELVGRPLGQLLHPDDVGPCLGGAEAVAGGALAGAWEGRVVRRDGAAIWMGWEVRASHRLRRYFCVARPLAQEEVRRQERFKVDFINMAAHELNTPLTPIQLGLDTLSMRLDPVLGRDAHESVEMLRRNFRRLQDLVTELLDSARLHAGRLPLEMRETDLSTLAVQAAAAKREAAAEVGVELGLRVEPGVRAKADADRLL